MTDFSDSYSFSFLIDSSGLPLGTSYQKSGSTSYGAYGIAKNNKMSDVSALEPNFGHFNLFTSFLNH